MPIAPRLLKATPVNAALVPSSSKEHKATRRNRKRKAKKESKDRSGKGSSSSSKDRGAELLWEVAPAGSQLNRMDLLMIETVFDTQNCKTAIFAVGEYFLETKKDRLPVMLSATIADNSGRTLPGRTIEAFYVSVKHARAFTVGCSTEERFLQETR